MERATGSRHSTRTRTHTLLHTRFCAPFSTFWSLSLWLLDSLLLLLLHTSPTSSELVALNTTRSTKPRKPTMQSIITTTNSNNHAFGFSPYQNHPPWLHQRRRHKHDRRRSRVRQHPQRWLPAEKPRCHHPTAKHVHRRERHAHVDAAQETLPHVKGIVPVVRQQEGVRQAVPADNFAREG